jgi:hypothetical protein
MRKLLLTVYERALRKIPLHKNDVNKSLHMRATGVEKTFPGAAQKEKERGAFSHFT